MRGAIHHRVAAKSIRNAVEIVRRRGLHVWLECEFAHGGSIRRLPDDRT